MRSALASLSLFAILSTSLTQPALAQAQATAPASEVETVDQLGWSRFLYLTVRTPEQLAPFFSKRASAPVGSMIDRNSDEMQKPVANAIPFSVLKDLHKKMVTDYLDAMAAVNFAKLSKAEQLSIMLNVHNAALINRFIIVGLPRNGRLLDPVTAAESKYLDVPAATLGGKSYSVRALRQKIIAEGEDPNVIYGMWTGMMGGPEIQRGHLNAKDIHGQLLAIKNDFMARSLAYRKTKAGKMSVSEFYNFYRPLFPNDEELLYHLRLPETATLDSRNRFFDRKVAAFTMIRKDDSEKLGILSVSVGDQRGLSGN